MNQVMLMSLPTGKKSKYEDHIAKFHSIDWQREHPITYIIAQKTKSVQQGPDNNYNDIKSSI